jgi:hypothetical protein
MKTANRIGCSCWYQLATSQAWRAGILRAWSIDYENCDFTQQFPVGIIEDDETEMCQSIYVKRICFAEFPPDRKVEPPC